MATAPKSNPKVVPIDESAVEAPPPPKKSKKKLILIVAGAVIALVGGGGWYLMRPLPSETGAQARHEPAKPPVFIAMDPFTVNLAPEAGEQYLQVAFTLQVEDQDQVELIKLYMPLVRSRILMLLGSKKASDIATTDGKTKLQEEILQQIKKPFTEHAAPQGVNSVLFTSFVIQ